MTVDEKRLAELFRDAVADAPPPSFDEHDVAEASRRATARRRSLIVGGSTLAVVVLAVAGAMVGLGTFGHTGGRDSSGAAVAAPSSPTVNRPFDAHRNDFPGTPPLQGGGTTGRAGSTGSAPGGCGPTDEKLAAALAGELSSVGDNTAEVATNPAVGSCPAGATVAAYSVHDGSAAGTVSAVVVDSGYRPADLGVPPGSVTGHRPTASGREIVVISTPAGGSAVPFASRVTAIAMALAPRF